MSTQITQTFDISELTALESVANALVADLAHPAWIYLVGDLGAGKTTFSQFFIRAKGYNGRITSPTYAIMQDYDTQSGAVVHCDLYRLSDAEELFEIGLLEHSDEHQAITLVEWPSKGKGALPNADITLHFKLLGEKRQLTVETAGRTKA